MENIKSADEMTSELLHSFKKDNVVLYVGKKGKSELTPELCTLSWSCVITSCTNEDFGVEFPELKHVHVYTNKRELPSRIFNKNELPIIQIYGNDGIVDENLVDYDELLRKTFLDEEAKNLFNHIIIRLDIRSRLVIVGYDPTDVTEYPILQFIVSLSKIAGGQVEIYGVEEPTTLSKEIEKRGGNIFPELLSNILKQRQELNSVYEYEEVDQETKNIFYKGNEPVAISKSILLRSQNFIQLLTDELIYRNRPLGRIEQATWFYNFLNDSAEAPQWYGYLPQSEFYLKRDYEDALVELVKNVLGAQNMKQEENVPIILQGDPGSSKSIELGALAYRIYQERMNPVIYIKNDNLSFSEQSNELTQLDELMQEVENVGKKDTRFLIIWDSSSYRKVVENAKNLIRYLDNRGRRLVLVCSAYSGSSGDSFEEENNTKLKSQWYYYKPKEKIFVVSNSKHGDIYYDGECYCLKAGRKMPEREIVQLQNKAKLYALAPQEELNRVWAKLADDDDIFNYFFDLIETLRPKLENNLTKEQRLVSNYVDQQLAKIHETHVEKKSLSPMMGALLNAGIVLDEEDKKLLEEEEDDLSDVYDLNRFNICVAIFSRFKLDTPYSLALRMLCKDKDEFFGKNICYNNRELFMVLTNQIPYIHYCEAEEGKFVFRYRNTLEAELFLRRNAVESEQQIDIICSALDYYAESYLYLGDIDESLKKVLSKILRMVGPNTDYIDFQGKDQNEHKMFMKHMEKLIERLSQLRMLDKVPDADAGFANIEITFIREYYGKLWDILNGYNRQTAGTVTPWEANPLIYTEDSYVKRLEQLQRALDLALDKRAAMQSNIASYENLFERKYHVEQLNSLSVEACLCSRAMEGVWEEYGTFCKAASKEPAISNIHALAYNHQYDILLKATITSPLNGYAYNALFRAFEKEYEDSNETRKIKLLSEVRMLADDASTLPITNRGMNGKDELTDHIGRILQFSCIHKVTIEDIESGDEKNPFYKLFMDMLEQSSASAICFICQQELDTVGLGGQHIAGRKQETKEEFVLNKRQLEVCEKIMKFMTKEDYELCICKNPYALYLLLRIEWMLFNGRPLFSEKERQLTYLTLDNWREINRVCEMYVSCAGATNPKPIVTLIYALSELQLTRDYKKAATMMMRLCETAFYSTPRMRVPYLICFEPGVPELYTGKVISTKNYTGFIRYTGLPERMGSNVGIRFKMRNLGLRSMPDVNALLKNLELGLGYTGYAAYRKADIGGELQ